MSKMMYQFKGKLQSYICQECLEDLAGATVRLYRHQKDQAVNELVATNPKDTFKLLSDEEVKRKEKSLIAETVTNGEGEFTFELDSEEHDYNGDAFEVDVRLESVPGYDPESVKGKKKRPPVQFTITSLRPIWKEDGNVLVTPPWKYAIPYRFWCYLLALFDVWVICGRFVTCEGKQPLPGALVRAYDADCVQDDFLGDAVTDGSGRFLIYYTSAAFKKTPVSWVNVELIGGPDVYFKVEYGGDLLIDEGRCDGRKAGRQNIGNCFCIALCTDKVVPPIADQIPHWERVEYYEVDTDFSIEGYAGVDSHVMCDSIDMHGNMPLKNALNNKALKYRFLVGEWKWPGGTPDPAVMPSIQPLNTDLLPVTFLATATVGYLYYIDGNGVYSSHAVKIGSSDLDGDGCITLLGKVETVDMHDSTTSNIAITESNFVGAYELMRINTISLTPPPYDVTQDLGTASAGNPVAAGDRAPIRRFKFRFQVFDFDQVPDLVTDNKTLDAMVIDNSPVKFALFLDELSGSLCNPITNNVHILYTIDHPHLEYFNIKIENNAGVAHDQTDVPPLPSGTWGGDFFFRGGQSGTTGFDVDVSGDSPCAYAVILRWKTRHYHYSGRSLERFTQILYCK
jgi:hypothetical protein